MKMQIAEYKKKHNLTILKFAEFLDVYPRTIDGWLAREKYFHSVKTEGVRGIGFTSKRAFKIEVDTSGEIEALYLLKLSSI